MKVVRIEMGELGEGDGSLLVVASPSADTDAEERFSRGAGRGGLGKGE
jgi:hypothetical protein